MHAPGTPIYAEGKDEPVGHVGPHGEFVAATALLLDSVGDLTLAATYGPRHDRSAGLIIYSHREPGDDLSPARNVAHAVELPDGARVPILGLVGTPGEPPPRGHSRDGTTFPLRPARLTLTLTIDLPLTITQRLEAKPEDV